MTSTMLSMVCGFSTWVLTAAEMDLVAKVAYRLLRQAQQIPDAPWRITLEEQARALRMGAGLPALMLLAQARPCRVRPPRGATPAGLRYLAYVNRRDAERLPDGSPARELILAQTRILEAGATRGREAWDAETAVLTRALSDVDDWVASLPAASEWRVAFARARQQLIDELQDRNAQPTAPADRTRTAQLG